MKPYYAEAGIEIYHGDCRDVLQTLPEKSVTLLWTDPPYGHGNFDADLQASITGIPGSRRQAAPSPIANDTPETMRAAVDEMLLAAVRILRSDCCCCCCCCCGGGGPRPTFAWVADRMDRNGLSFFHAVILDKRDRGIGLGWRFRRDYEMAMVAHRTGGRLAWVDGQPATSNIQAMVLSNARIHPNEKPVDLPGRFIVWTTKPDDLVLDPFMGSGTTLRAAKDLGRRAIGIEIEERYCEIAAERLSQGVLAL